MSQKIKKIGSIFLYKISPEDEDFEASGLVSKSVIRLSFLTVISRSSIIGSIGSISQERHQRLLNNLSQYLVQSSE
jgi:mRNA interferase MazF